MTCGFVRVMKGDDVVIERGFERKEVDGEVIARNADRRMRCLRHAALVGILCRDGLLTHIIADCLKERTSVKLSILSSGCRKC